MILLYRVLSILLYPLLILLTYYRNFLKKEDPKRFKEKIFISHFKPSKKNDSKLVWFHAASVGEFKSILPIISLLNSKKKNLKFLITTTTLSSSNLAETELKIFDNVEHRFFPFDVPFLINNFLHLWKPDKIFLVDSEIWPNLLLKAKQLNIPIALINARLTARSYNKWMLFPKVAKKIFSTFDLCLCSNLETKKFLEKLNISNSYFKGNIKLIGKIDKNELINFNEDFLLNEKFWLAASTHPGEDLFCIKTHLEIKKKYKDIKTFIAPRHIERSEEIKLLSLKYNLDAQILNRNEKIFRNKEIIIINYFGELNSYFKYADSVFMGKSIIEKLENEGGQNPVEAAKLNCKIYHGPFVYNFKDIYKILEENSIAKKVNNFQELSENLINDFQYPKNQKLNLSYKLENIENKTLVDTIKLVENFLFNDDK